VIEAQFLIYTPPLCFCVCGFLKPMINKKTRGNSKTESQGLLLGNYRLKETIGTGSFGKVKCKFNSLSKKLKTAFFKHYLS
jgi:hypothetical protein